MPGARARRHLTFAFIGAAAALGAGAATAPDKAKPDAVSIASAGTEVAFALSRDASKGVAIRISPAALSAAAGRAGVSGGVFRVEGFPLPGFRTVGLELAPFSIVGPETRFVKGRLGHPDEPLDFDPASIALYRGRVEGYAGSHVVMGISDRHGSFARIDLGPGERKYLLSSIGGESLPLREGEAAVFEARTRGGVGLGVPLCGLNPLSRLEDVAEEPRGPIPDEGVLRGPALDRNTRRLQLAVETDYEYFELFGDVQAAGAYVVQLYAAVSDIYIRDINTRVELSFVRLWDTPDDLFNAGESPLADFRSYWNANMQHVPRAAAQFLTGRRNLNAGGVAYLSSLCNNNAYSWSGYTLGFMGDPDRPHWTNRDIMITAHELGHNCGTLHTHDYQLDGCDVGGPNPQRGTIMSYCGQTYSGGDDNHDLWFHEHTAQIMRTYTYGRPCIVRDCNGNGVPDAQDIASGTSQDVNGNGVPDECEDCNGNGRLDPLDIAMGFSQDVNGNGIPDECEPDCNGNGIPDSMDIALGTSLDVNANRIPDECEGDCDGNGVADWVQIQANMALDIDRNVVLDSCQQCLPGGPTDIIALDHAWNCYVAGLAQDAAVREFYAANGVQVNVGGAGRAPDAQDLIITPSRRVLVSSGSGNKVVELAPDGAFVRDLVPAGFGGVSQPTGLLLTGRGTLLVASRNTNSVLEYDVVTGASLGAFVQPGAGGLTGPFGMAFSPDGNLFVTSSNNRVLEFNGQTGAFVRTFVPQAGNGGLNDPRGILFKPDGNLLVCSRMNNRVLEFNGQTGAFIRQWNRGGTADRLSLDEPWGIRLGPDGDVYVSRSHVHRSGGGDGEPLHLTNARIYQFDIRNGNLVRAYIMGTDTQLYWPTGFDFMPGDATDCNRNHRPDLCDIAAGYSRDRNRNNRPDECDCLADWNSDGSVNSSDISAFITAWLLSINTGVDDGDFNGDFTVNSTDISAFITAWLDAVNHGC